MRGSRILLTAAVSLGTATVATIGMASPAFARFDNGGYTTPPAQVEGVAVQRDVPQQAPVSVEAEQTQGSSLPVTGGDIAGMAGVGFVLLGTGTVLVRRTRRRA